MVLHEIHDSAIFYIMACIEIIVDDKMLYCTYKTIVNL